MLLFFLILLVRRRASINRHNRVPVFYKITQEQGRSATEYLLPHQNFLMKELNAAVKARFLNMVTLCLTKTTFLLAGASLTIMHAQNA